MVVLVVAQKSIRMCSLLLLEEDLEREKEATVWTVPKLIIYNISLIERSPLYKKKKKKRDTEISNFRKNGPDGLILNNWA